MDAFTVISTMMIMMMMTIIETPVNGLLWICVYCPLHLWMDGSGAHPTFFSDSFEIFLIKTFKFLIVNENE